jgi:hypothetical protein
VKALAGKSATEHTTRVTPVWLGKDELDHLKQGISRLLIRRHQPVDEVVIEKLVNSALAAQPSGMVDFVRQVRAQMDRLAESADRSPQAAAGGKLPSASQVQRITAELKNLPEAVVAGLTAFYVQAKSADAAATISGVTRVEFDELRRVLREKMRG